MKYIIDWYSTHIPSKSGITLLRFIAFAALPEWLL